MRGWQKLAAAAFGSTAQAVQLVQLKGDARDLADAVEKLAGKALALAQEVKGGLEPPARPAAATVAVCASSRTLLTNAGP